MAVTVADVRLIYSGSESDPQVQAAIDTILIMAAKCLALMPDDATRDQVTKYLAAHLLTVIASNGVGVATSSKLGDASDSFASGALGKGLRSSAYGQMAIALDPNDCISKLGNPRATLQKV